MADFNTLQQGIRGRVFQPSDGIKYNLEIKRLWNAYLHTKHPLAFVKVRETSDVAKTVKFCVENKLELCVCCGGTTGFAVVDNALVIDMSLMCNVMVDVESKTAVVEGGALVADADKTLHEYGFALPLGSFSKLGVAGMTLMGGKSFLTKNCGATSDSVLEYDLVTANGDVIKVSDEENEDLFWGMKGSGFNFGIVTSMKFKMFKMPDLIVGGTLYYPLSRAKEVMKAVRDYYEQRNDNYLSLSMTCFVLPIGPEVLIKLHYNGSVATGGEIVQDLEDLTHPIKNTCKPIAHCEFQTQGDEMFRNRYSGGPGVFLSEITDEIIDYLVDTIEKLPGPGRSFAGTHVMFFMLSTRSNESRVDSISSFPFHGQMRFWLGMNGSTDKEENLDVLKKWMAEIQSVNAKYGLAPYGGKAEEVEKRLKQLKRKYDPGNIFHNNPNNINPKE